MGHLSKALEHKKQSAEAGRLCKLGEVVTLMDDEDVAAFNDAVRLVKEDLGRPQSDRIFSQKWLVTAINASGYGCVGKTVVSDHLHGRCACGKTRS